MKSLAEFSFLVIIFSALSATYANTEEDGNEAPIIGVLTQESETTTDTHELSGSYVNFIQAAGGRVVPIFIDRDERYYRKMFSYINGLIFPGSWGDKLDISSEYFPKSGYTKVGKIMFDLAKEANDKGDYFPILGSCNGFQLLVYLAAGNQNLMSRCNSEDYATTLEFTDFDNLSNTKMFKTVPKSVQQALYTEKISYQYHNNCLTPTNFTAAGLDNFFNIVAKNKDRDGKEFITLMEGKKYPFYTMFIHPESVLDSFNNEDDYCHNSPTSKNAMKAAQFFARFFVYEARKSKHKFAKKSTEVKCLIYNFKRKYTPHSVDCAPVGYSFKLRKIPPQQ